MGTQYNDYSIMQYSYKCISCCDNNQQELVIIVKRKTRKKRFEQYQAVTLKDSNMT